MAVSHRTADDVGTRHVQPAIRARHASLLSLDPPRELWLIIFRGLAGAIDLEAPRSAWFWGRSRFCGLSWCSYRRCWVAVTGPRPPWWSCLLIAWPIRVGGFRFHASSW